MGGGYKQDLDFFIQKLKKAINILDNAKHDEFERVKIALNILKATPHSSLDDIYTFITKRINLGFVFDAAPEAKHSCISLLKHDENLSFNTPNSQKYPALDSQNPQHKLIIGENYDALKNLLVTHREKIDVIYIDPPYNTEAMKSDGNDYKANVKSSKFIYRDKFTRTGWLNMMNERLKLARQLLSDSGVIFISIDDNEQAYLKVLCDEIFGEENFVACFPRVTKKAGKSTDAVLKNHDYILMYKKYELSLSLDEADSESYPLKDEFFNERGGYKLSQTLDYDSLQYSKTMDYEAEVNGIKFYPGGKEKWLERQGGNTKQIDWVWRWSKDKLDFGIKNGFVVVKGDRIYTKTYHRATISSKKPYLVETLQRGKKISSVGYVETEIYSNDIWDEFLQNKYSNDNATKDICGFFQKNTFNYPKPVELIKHLIKISTNGGGADTKPQIILDFFAGSGTTAQAVMELNKQDGGKRQCILVTNNENNIAKSVTYERIYRICKGVGTKGESFEWASKNEALEYNGWDIFEIETHELQIDDEKKAKELIEKAKAQFKIFKKDFEFEGEFDIYNKLSSLSPKKDEK